MRKRTLKELWQQRRRMFETHCDIVLARDGYLDHYNQNCDERWQKIEHIINEYLRQGND
jgi:hypothetical protein